MDDNMNMPDGIVNAFFVGFLVGLCTYLLLEIYAIQHSKKNLDKALENFEDDMKETAIKYQKKLDGILKKAKEKDEEQIKHIQEEIDYLLLQEELAGMDIPPPEEMH